MKRYFFKTVRLLLVICTCPYSGCYEKCEDCHEYIFFVNKSHQDIACNERWGLVDKQWYCDPQGQFNQMIKIEADSSMPFKVRGGKGERYRWELFFKKWDVIELLVADYETSYQYEFEMKLPCDTIRKYLPVLHCYELTLEDLQRMNWTVVYPPEEAMKDMKQWPPYGSE